MNVHNSSEIGKTKTWFLLAIAIIAVVLTILIGSFHPQPHRFYEMPRRGFCFKRLTREILDQSFELGTQFLLNNQQPDGNFTYEYDWIKKTYTRGDSQVRQAGAMWGLALIYQAEPTPKVAAAVEKAMKFFEQNSKITPDGARYVVYPGDSQGRMGTVALCALSYIDYLRGAKSSLSKENFQHHRQHLNEYLKFIVGARTQDGLWHSGYDFSDGRTFGKSSPYVDGESLLALIKAAKYMGRLDLKPAIIDSADAGYRYNIQEALRQHPDSNTTKGYYQWSSMAFFELATTDWEATEKYGDYILDLADWMIDVHKTLWRTRNTAYAYEGIIHAYKLAMQRKDMKRAKKFACVIDTGLEKLTTWQVGSPTANRFIREHPTEDSMAIGGVQNHRREAPLRIDVTQHQVHAVILARRYVYVE